MIMIAREKLVRRGRRRRTQAQAALDGGAAARWTRPGRRWPRARPTCAACGRRWPTPASALRKHELGAGAAATSSTPTSSRACASASAGWSSHRVVGDYHKRPPVDASHQARIQELTELLDRMGPVNLDAVREHAEAEERYTYYAEQKADLEKALDDLEKAIAQMNRESKRLFKTTFDGINARFKTLFPKMFRGGQAELGPDEPRRHAGDGDRDPGAAAGQEAREHRAHERRREGAHRGVAHLRDLPVQAVALLHPRRGRRAAR